MPRRLPEKTKTINRGQRRFKQAIYQSRVFQRIPVREGQEIDVVIDDIGSRGDAIVRVGRKFAIAEKITV